MRMIIALLVLLTFAPAADAETFHIDLSLEFGKVYDVVAGQYEKAVFPGVSVSFGGLYVEATSYLANGRSLFEQDFIVGYEKTIGRITLTSNAGRYYWREGVKDWTTSGGIKIRVR